MANYASPKKSSSGVAVLDLGSNSLLLLVVDSDGRPVCEEAVITRLGEGVFSSGRLASGAIERTRRAASVLCTRAREAGAGTVVGVGTEALRRASDAEPFLADLAEHAGLDAARILTGDEEAAYTIEASRRDLGPRAHEGLTVVDVGGGSTELAWLDPESRVRGISLPAGTVRLSEACVSEHPTPPAQVDALRQRADAVLAVCTPERHPGLGRGSIVAVAGTATTAAALDLELAVYDPARVEGYALSRAALAHWIARLAPLDLAARRALPGLEPGRADVIVAGLVILDSVLERLGVDDFRASGRGVRHGVAIELLAGRGPV